MNFKPIIFLFIALYPLVGNIFNPRNSSSLNNTLVNRILLVPKANAEEFDIRSHTRTPEFKFGVCEEGLKNVMKQAEDNPKKMKKEIKTTLQLCGYFIDEYPNHKITPELYRIKAMTHYYDKDYETMFSEMSKGIKMLIEKDSKHKRLKDFFSIKATLLMGAYGDTNKSEYGLAACYLYKEAIDRGYDKSRIPSDFLGICKKIKVL